MKEAVVICNRIVSMARKYTSDIGVINILKKDLELLRKSKTNEDYEKYSQKVFKILESNFNISINANVTNSDLIDNGEFKVDGMNAADIYFSSDIIYDFLHLNSLVLKNISGQEEVKKSRLLDKVKKVLGIKSK